MVSNKNTIISNVYKKKQVNKEMFESMIDFIFLESKKQIHKFEELSIYLPGLFIFFYGKIRLIKFKKELELYIEKINSGYIVPIPKTFLEKMTLQDLKELLIKTDYLLQRYEEYINEKRTIKKAYKESKAFYQEH